MEVHSEIVSNKGLRLQKYNDFLKQSLYTRVLVSRFLDLSGPCNQDTDEPVILSCVQR